MASVEFAFLVFLTLLGLFFLCFGFWRRLVSPLIASGIFFFIVAFLMLYPIGESTVTPGYGNSTTLVAPAVVVAPITLPAPYPWMLGVTFALTALFIFTSAYAIYREPVKAQEENQ